MGIPIVTNGGTVLLVESVVLGGELGCFWDFKEVPELVRKTEGGESSGRIETGEFENGKELDVSILCSGSKKGFGL